MTELCKAQLVFILVFSDLYNFSSFILSHPLYLSYFLFFSPYLFKLLSFLSPLFLTTSLLLFSISHEYSCWNWNWEFLFSSQNDMGFLTGVFKAIVKQSMFRSKLSSNHIADDDDDDDDDQMEMEYIRFEDSEVFKIVFDIPILINNHDDAEEVFLDSSSCSCFLKESDEWESGFSCCTTVEEHKRQDLCGTKEDKKVVELLFPVRNGSEAESNKVEPQVGPLQSKQSGCHSLESSRTMDYNLGSYGSMRKEKEWKKTLACKLFEERHNVVGGGEGMDMLWETYEVESSKKDNSRNNNNLQKKYHQKVKEEEKEEEEEDDDESNGKLCCLQAFKFSSGKMNLGMKKPNLVKITKAIKGLGWLHHQVTTKRSKKVHNGE